VSLFGSIFPIGAMIGPIFGGLFVSYGTWRGIFLVNVPIGVAVILLGLRFIPPDRPRPAGPRPKMNLMGMALLATGLLAGMFAASYLGEDQARAWSVAFIAPLAIAVISLAGFFRDARRSAQPFIAPALIYGPGFGAVNLLNALYGGVTFGMVALIPLYAVNRYGLNELQSATLLTAQGLAAILLSILAAFALRRTGHRLPLYVGSLLVAIGMALLAIRAPGAVGPYAWLASSAFLIGVGTGVMNPASRNAGLQLAPGHASTLAALRSMCLQMGTMFTISVVTAVMARAGDPGSVQAGAYVAALLIQLAGLPLLSRVPEHRGAW
jgi:MFS family permease